MNTKFKLRNNNVVAIVPDRLTEAERAALVARANKRLGTAAPVILCQKCHARLVGDIGTLCSTCIKVEANRAVREQDNQTALRIWKGLLWTALAIGILFVAYTFI